MAEAIRDFIYLDVERVRSWVAQAGGGVVAERAHERGHEAGGKLVGKGGLPFIAEVGGEADYRYHRSMTETLSIHDAIFAEFYQYLPPPTGPLSDREWEEDAFRDGAFVQVTGRVKIVDYSAAIARIESLPKFAEAVGRLGGQPSSGASGQSSASSRRDRRAANRSTQPQGQTGFDRGQMRDIALTAKEVYSDLIRIRVMPFLGDNRRAYVGAGERRGFRHDLAALSTTYGSVIDADWTVVAQINKGRRPEVTEVLGEDAGLEERFEDLVAIFDQLSEVAQGIRFPAVAMTPVAIFRDVQAEGSSPD